MSAVSIRKLPEVRYAPLFNPNMCFDGDIIADISITWTRHLTHIWNQISIMAWLIQGSHISDQWVSMTFQAFVITDLIQTDSLMKHSDQFKNWFIENNQLKNNDLLTNRMILWLEI